ncbi:signal peptidase I [Agrobacterium sp. SHOUNA12C]|nr:signal peptidase I [Agrobacterium sp. BETTINA12B]MCJ9758260.1 signal peptidase I [Agrobacterium sp. SHOUNA12C]
MRSPQLTTSIATLLLSIPLAVVAFAPVALAETERESAARTLVEPAYPIWLAQANAWTTDMRLLKSMTEHAIGGLAALLPADCDVARMKRDICGIKLFNVPSSSMSPTVQESEMIAAQVLDYKPVRRGDTIVHKARFQGGDETIALTRIIGLPGETVKMRNGHVFINGKEMIAAATGQVIKEEFVSGEVYTETTPEGRSYSTLLSPETPPGVVNEFGPLTLPEDSYFVLGDNRHSSVDSRYPRDFNGDGLVRKESILGVTLSVLVSKDPDRVGKQL